MKQYTKESVIEDICNVANGLSKNSLSSREYLEHGQYSHGYIRKLFGSILVAFQEAGLKSHKRVPHNRIDDRSIILEDIRQVAKTLGVQSLSQQQYFKYGQYSDGPIKRLFGSVANAFKEAGLEKYKPILPSDIIQDMLKVAQDGRLSSTQYKQYGKYSLSTIRYTFGGFHRARKVAGLTKDKRSDFIDTKTLLLQLKRYSQQYKNPPTKRSINIDSSYPCDKTYYAAFPGQSWGAILNLAGVISLNQYQGKDGYWYDSFEEMNIANILYTNYIEYLSHHPVCNERKWTCDFYLPEKDLWIEYDGLGNFRRNKEKFLEKIQYYEDNEYNYKVLHYDEDVIDTLDLRLSYCKQDLDVRMINHAEAMNFLDTVHYLGFRSDRYYIGCFLKTQLCGVITFGKNTNPNEELLCLNRFATLDIMDKNFGSWFMSRALRLLKHNGYRGKVVSWSDPRQHSGGLYRACNFKLIPTKQKNDYVYVDKDTGTEYHKSRCRVPAGQSEKEYADSLNLIKINVPPKQRWEIQI